MVSLGVASGHFHFDSRFGSRFGTSTVPDGDVSVLAAAHSWLPGRPSVWGLREVRGRGSRRAAAAGW